MSKFFGLLLAFAAIPSLVTAQDDKLISRTIADSVAKLSASDSTPVDPNPEIRLKELFSLFEKLEAEADTDSTIELYKILIDSHTNQIFNKLAEPAQSKWKEVRDTVWTQASTSANQKKTPAEKVTEIRRIFRGPVKTAIQAEIFRIEGTDGTRFNAADAKIVADILVNVLNATQMSAKRAALVGVTKLGGDVAPLPGIDGDRIATCKNLLSAIESIENRAQDTWPTAAYGQAFNDKTDPIFNALGENKPAAWKNARVVILDIAERSSNSNLTEYRRIINGPVKRAIETEIARIEGIKTRTPLNLKGLSNAQLQAIINQSSSGNPACRCRTHCRCWQILRVNPR